MKNPVAIAIIFTSLLCWEHQVKSIPGWCLSSGNCEFNDAQSLSATGFSSVANNPNNTKMNLDQAEKTSAQLFEAIQKNNLMVAGKSEKQLNEEISQLALEKFGIEKHWHKKIVRTGRNTMSVYNDNPADLIIQKDDILFVDYGIIANGWESDYARTFVLGNDSRKIKLKRDVEKAWYETQAWYRKQRELKASDFFAYIVNKAKEYGYTYGGEIAGHIVGEFPHEQPADPKSHDLDVHPDNSTDMFARDAAGNERHWILEMHFVDKQNNIAAYMEQLL